VIPGQLAIEWHPQTQSSHQKINSLCVLQWHIITIRLGYLPSTHAPGTHTLARISCFSFLLFHRRIKFLAWDAKNVCAETFSRQQQKYINSFLSRRWYSRVASEILLWVLHAKISLGYSERPGKKGSLYYSSRVRAFSILLSNNKHYYIKYTSARNVKWHLVWIESSWNWGWNHLLCTAARSTLRERICSSRGHIFLMCFLMKRGIICLKMMEKQKPWAYYESAFVQHT